MAEKKILNIFEKMNLITDELGVVAKNLKVEVTKSSSYKAVSERDILDAVKPLENKYGVYSYPADRQLVDDEILTSESTYNGNTTTKTTFFTRVKTIYRFVNVEKPEEYIDMVTFAEGIDTQDKGSGKAMTYGDKYALMKAYKISTGDDPDAVSSKEEHYQKVEPNKASTADKISKTDVDTLLAKAKEKNVPIEEVLKHYGKSAVEDLTPDEWGSAMRKLHVTKCKTQE